MIGPEIALGRPTHDPAVSGQSFVRVAGRFGATALCLLSLSIGLGACSSSESSSRGPCASPQDQKRMDHGELDNARLREILDCLAAKNHREGPRSTEVGG